MKICLHACQVLFCHRLFAEVAVDQNVFEKQAKRPSKKTENCLVCSPTFNGFQWLPPEAKLVKKIRQSKLYLIPFLQTSGKFRAERDTSNTEMFFFLDTWDVSKKKWRKGIWLACWSHDKICDVFYCATKPVHRKEASPFPLRSSPINPCVLPPKSLFTLAPKGRDR